MFYAQSTSTVISRRDTFCHHTVQKKEEEKRKEKGMSEVRTVINKLPPIPQQFSNGTQLGSGSHSIPLSPKLPIKNVFHLYLPKRCDTTSCFNTKSTSTQCHRNVFKFQAKHCTHRLYSRRALNRHLWHFQEPLSSVWCVTSPSSKRLAVTLFLSCAYLVERSEFSAFPLVPRT